MQETSPQKLSLDLPNPTREVYLKTAEWVDDQEGFLSDEEALQALTNLENQLIAHPGKKIRSPIVHFLLSTMVSMAFGLGLGVALAFSIDNGSFDTLKRFLKELIS